MAGSAARSLAKLAFVTTDLVRAKAEGPKLLIYHQVGAGLGRQMEVTESAFGRQMTWLQDHAEVVDLESALRRQREPHAERRVVLTFDDGYVDTFTAAFPLLEAMSFPFVIYLATESIETGSALTPGGQAEPLNWDQVARMMETDLVTVGSHTHTHLDLRGVSSDRITHELGTSDALIQRRLGVTSRHFAYPWGYWDSRADEIVRSRYETAVLGAGQAIRGSVDPYLINRIPVQLADGFWFFKRKVTRGLPTEESVRRLISGYRGP